MTVDPKMEGRAKSRLEILAVYDVWQAGGKTPYEYLFLLPNAWLEVDYAVWKVGVVRDNERFEKDLKSVDGEEDKDAKQARLDRFMSDDFDDDPDNSEEE